MIEKKETPPPAAIMRPKDVLAYLNISRTTLHHLHENDASFPRKIRFSARCVGWRKESIDSWLLAKEKGGAAL
jgi:predicted DNA-binding transcriptional regulator AlpA